MSVVKIKSSPAVLPAPASYLTADIAAAVGTFTVKNIIGFAVNQVLLIGELGAEGSEIVKTHASSAPSGSTVTLSANTVLPHYTGDKIYVMLYDQVEFSTALTATGSKSVLTTMNLWADNPSTEYIDTAGSTGYYFARFKNSISATFSTYSDAMAVAGWTSNSVGYMIERALRDLGVVLSEIIKVEDCYEWINEGLRLVQGKLKRWPEHYSYNAVVGQVLRGTNVIAVPTDAYDTETNKSVIAFRLGTGKNLSYLDPRTFDNQLEQVAKTQVTTQATSGQTTLAINNSYDFADSGYVQVYISNVRYSIRYTGVTRSATAGILTGVPASGTGSISVTIAVNTYVWQGETEGTPIWFTVRNGNFEWWPLADASNDNANAYSDYAKVATSVDSDGDTIDLQRFDIIQSYLTWRMWCKARKDGNLEMGAVYRGKFVPLGYYAQFEEKLQDAIKTLPSNNLFKIRPSINRIGSLRSPRRTADIQDLNINDQ